MLYLLCVEYRNCKIYISKHIITFVSIQYLYIEYVFCSPAYKYSFHELIVAVLNQTVDYIHCASGHVVSPSHRCISDLDQYGIPTGCRDMTHLQDCGK